MTPILDTEHPLEEATIQLFRELGWEAINAQEEIDGGPTLLGREHHGEVVLKRFLLSAIKRLNPDLPEAVFEQAAEQITRNRSVMSIVRNCSTLPTG